MRKYIIVAAILLIIGYFTLKIVGYSRLNGVIVYSNAVKDFDGNLLYNDFPYLSYAILDNKKETFVGIKSAYDDKGNPTKTLIGRNISTGKTSFEILINNSDIYPCKLKISSDDRHISLMRSDKHLTTFDIIDLKIIDETDLSGYAYDWLDSENILFSEGGYLKLYNIFSKEIVNYDNVYRGWLISLSADKMTVMYSAPHEDKIKVENLQTKKIAEVKRKKEASDYKLSPSGEYIAYTEGRPFTKFDKDTIIMNLKGQKMYKIGHCNGVNDWK